MNKDTNLIFEAYKNKLIESSAPTIPSDDEIQAALKEYNCSCSVDEIKHVIDTAISHYTLEDLKSGLYEDYQDAHNHSPTGGGKPRFDWKNTSTAALAVLLAKQLKYNRDVRERNARGENAEETSKLTMDVLVKAVEETLNPYRFEVSVCYLGQVMDKIEDMGFKLWGNGPDRESFNKCWEEFLSKNAYCYDMSATDSYDMDEETPRFGDNKLEKNGPGEYLFMEGSGRGPDVYLACEFAKKNGYKKIILNGLS
jgi:hypothetical protein